MALPTSYLTSTRNVEAILNSIITAQAPPKFTQAFLEQLGFKSSSDRLIINVLKAIGFISPSGVPTDRYFRYLDQTQSGAVLAEGIRDAYADLFLINKDAQNLTPTETKNKLRTLTQGKASEDVVQKMSATFHALAKQADFKADPKKAEGGSPEMEQADDVMPLADVVPPANGGPLPFGGLTYTIQIQLPESRDPEVYNALFSSLRTHLL
jgi:Family of unknown function (DUF5343)